MKKSFYSILFLFAGLLAGNNVNAQETADIYSVDFTQKDWHGWTPEGDYADKGLWTISEGALIAYGHMATAPCESRVVSPLIKLGTESNTVTFSYQGWYFNDITKEAGLAVREAGGEWIDIPIKYPAPDDYSVFNVGELPVPAELNGKEVQFAYKYSIISMNNMGYWFIQDFHLKGMQGEAPSEKADAGISYDVTEVTCTIGDPDFKAPVINNPNNLEVFYSSENESVAIAEMDGSLTIVAPGKVLIRALTLENEQFKKGEASYMLTVVDPDIVFMADFNIDECGFVEDTPEEKNHAWVRFWEGCMLADGYEKVQEMTSFYLVSPEFVLDEVGNAVSFDHRGNYFNDWEAEAQLHIREAGGEWVKLEGITYPTSSTDFTNSGELQIPSDLNGKNVQIGFMYAADGTFSSGMWYVDNVKVKRVVPTGIEVVEAEINDNKIYDLQGRRVNNPVKGLYIVNGKKIVIK